MIDSNRLSYGPFTERFEGLFAREHDCGYAVFCNSGTSALHIALAALKELHGWADGDEVLVPAVTFVATSNVVLHNRLTPVFVDVDPLTYNIDPAADRGEDHPPHAGHPARPSDGPAGRHGRRHRHRPQARAERGRGLVRDDVRRCRGRKVGSWGDIGCFSTYIAHYIVTGVGGLATTNDPELARHAQEPDEPRAGLAST